MIRTTSEPSLCLQDFNTTFLSKTSTPRFSPGLQHHVSLQDFNTTFLSRLQHHTSDWKFASDIFNMSHEHLDRIFGRSRTRIRGFTVPKSKLSPGLC
ncbi:hypothetical protein AVEN_4255-1 [Araneus ventricosus]|uniref:Uncharacterized protein n=1 Tax=Araneus ventricosus TaxID=182803 RepID=A0A4Y2SII4_ARAVE|nr:hypothetical protein AVEN_208537-1 [Araneus ventricosus]GBN88123.1 hypothetical protein AVEN_176268-1 [Araneus ventricosus]GBN92973.1 hypothetical protein AVEN_117037-1 [Araneus ventricosus]GBN92981.1 hypothetical protein AVEN_4255-1 [Araneus ventricosus]